MPYTPKISIITAVYNGAQYLEQTIESVLTQTYQNIEYIIIDGGSTDGTVELIKKHSHRLGYWVSEPDKGIYDAWNKGVKASTGEWIAFLGADDLLLPTAVELYVEELRTKGKHVDFVSSRVEFVDNDLRHLLFYGRPWKWSTHRQQMKVSHVGAFHHRRLFETYGYFNDSYKIAGDYEFLLRPKEHLKAIFIPTVTAKMRATGVSKTDNRVFKEAKQAKIETANRNQLMCYLEYHYQIVKNKLVGEIRSFLRKRKEANEN